MKQKLAQILTKANQQWWAWHGTKSFVQSADLKFQLQFYFIFRKSFTCGSGQCPAAPTCGTFLSAVCGNKTSLVVDQLIPRYRTPHLVPTSAEPHLYIWNVGANDGKPPWA